MHALKVLSSSLRKLLLIYMHFYSMLGLIGHYDILEMLLFLLSQITSIPIIETEIFSVLVDRCRTRVEKKTAKNMSKLKCSTVFNILESCHIFSEFQ